MSALVTPSLMDAGPLILGISWSLVGVSALFILLRLYVKCTRQRALWWDDHVVVASWVTKKPSLFRMNTSRRHSQLTYWCLRPQVMMLVSVGLLTYSVSLGFGQRITEISINTSTNLWFLIYITSVFSLLGTAWSKTSFALTLIRITEGPLRTAIWVVLASVNMALVANAALPFLRCSPVERNWNILVLEGECWDADISLWYSMFAAAFSGVMDLLLALVPWAVIAKTQMDGKEKFGVAICMSIGFL